MHVLGVGRAAIWRTRAGYLEGRLDFALQHMARPGQLKRCGTDQEAELAALACSDPPLCDRRRTVGPLTEVAQRQPQTCKVSRESIRRMLKSTVNRGAA